MRLKNLAAIAAASSLMLVSSPAMSAPSPARALSLSNVERASASTQDQSDLLDSGFMGFLLVFGAGAIAGALLYSVIKGGNGTPVSP